MTDKEKILKLCMGNEEDYWGLSGYGLNADYFVRYWELHNAVLEYLGEERYDFPMREFERQQKKG